MSTTKKVKGLTHDQVNWARQHDWYDYAVLEAGVGTYNHPSNLYRVHVTGKLRFTDFTELRSWAGY